MPRGSGKGQGMSGQNAGQGGGRGGGRGGGGGAGGGGRGGGSGLGPGGNCVCASCGEKIAHTAGKPCYEQKCPKCGGVMTRER